MMETGDGRPETADRRMNFTTKTPRHKAQEMQ